MTCSPAAARREQPRPPLFQHFPGYLGAGGGTWRTTPGGVIRDGDWKLLEFFEDGRLELYNLKDDIGEKHNLAAAQSRQSQGIARKTSCLAQDTQCTDADQEHEDREVGPRKAERKKQKLSVEDESE